jgi:hypothetical protein
VAGAEDFVEQLVQLDEADPARAAADASPISFRTSAERRRPLPSLPAETSTEPFHVSHAYS